jgi:hypothetical protein
MDFPFHQVYALDDYNTSMLSSVFFGMYRFEDHELYSNHGMFNHVHRTIFWTGQDALDFDWDHNSVGSQIQDRNITAHPKIYKILKGKVDSCLLVRPAAFLNIQKPQVLGKKIYAYCPSSAPDYHGKKIIDELRCGGYEIVIGDGQFTQEQWRNGRADFFYKDICIGLCLSEFAGGGGSIIEMGLRGINVVTNVFELPNCIPWNSIHDVTQAIEDQMQYVGHTNITLSQYVWDSLDHKHEWLEI